MAQDLALSLAQTIERELPNLRGLTEERASMARAPGKWAPKEELGHLIDSAANNHLRFVRAAIDAEFRGPGYAQDDWVRLHGYSDMLWETIVNIWFQYNSLLGILVDKIPDDRLGALCFIGTDPGVTLRFLIEDYILHMQHHIDQLLGRPVITKYPGQAISAVSTVPPDDLGRALTLASADSGENIRHVGVVGDTYTILLPGKDTAGRFCLIDMHVPPGGGPPPHRHDFEETFIVLEGELAATFRGTTSVVRAGETVHIPANAPHQFRNSSASGVRMLCICSPAGQEDFFLEVGVPVATRTTAPPQLDQASQAAFIAKVQQLAPKYRTELLREA
jgi:quercetin dioxygenase-like cupin family protein